MSNEKPDAVTGPLGRGVRPVSDALQPIAYLYHDAASAEAASPLLHSTLLVMAADRRPQFRYDTALVALAQAQKLVAAERERWEGIVCNALDLYDRLETRRGMEMLADLVAHKRA